MFFYKKQHNIQNITLYKNHGFLRKKGRKRDGKKIFRSETVLFYKKSETFCSAQYLTQ